MVNKRYSKAVAAMKGYPVAPTPTAVETGGSAGKEKARDLLARQTQLETVRRHYEPVWRDVAEYCAPDAPEFLLSGYSSSTAGADNQVVRSDRRTRRTYDVTVRVGQRRLAAGLESLITPQSDKWHGLTTAAFDDEETDEEREWGEELRDFLFAVRYSAASGFVPALQQVYNNVIRFGPGYLYPEEDFSGAHMRYAALPVAECWIARNRWGAVDTFHRRYRRSARVCVQMFGDRTPKKIVDMANDPVRKDERVDIVHAIYPNSERRSYRRGSVADYIDGPFSSCHVIVEEEAVVREKTFNAFPVACFSWARDDGDDYGTSPIIELLTEVREINAVRKDTLRGIQQTTDPPMAIGSKIDWLPPLDAGSRHPGLIDDQGRALFAPLNTGIRLDPALMHIERSQATIKEGLYVNLFQTLVNKPGEQTATEALIRNEEKGALLGPAGSSIQGGLASLTDRELSILEGQGIYEPESRFAPPETLSGKSIRPLFTSPLDLLRKAGEARATIEATTIAGQMEAIWPGTKDNIDADEAYRVIVGAGRAPQRILRRRDEMDAQRERDARAMQARAGMAGAAQAATIARDAIPAIAKAADAGLLPGLGARAPA